jgi:hypothetical protein
MASWEQWELGRVVLGFTAVLFVGVWVQLTLMHWAGGFKHPAMWAPVLATPIVVGVVVAGVVTREGVVGVASAVVLAAAVVLGLAGTLLHVRGVRSQVGGLNLRNVLSGPPPVLPLAYALAGLLGLGALMWNA